jgi:vacuolar-type H+-ATPase subunit D/Vma8
MPRKPTVDRLKTLREKREQLEAQLRALEARNKQADRKADARRKEAPAPSRWNITRKSQIPSSIASCSGC